MKRITLSCCLYLPFLAQAQTTALVHVAGSDYPVIFADTNLSSIVKKRVASDLAIVFSLAPSFEELKSGREVAEGVFSLNIDMSMFCLSEWNEGISIVDQINAKNIQVNKVVSDKYLQTFALMKVHSNAVQKAHEFVALMNSTNLLSQPIQVLRALRHVELLPEGEDLSDDGVRQFATERQKYKYPAISSRNFFLQRIPQLDDAEVLVACLYMIDKSDPSPEKVYGVPIDFYKGRWGFGRSPLDVRRNEIVE